MVLSSLRTVVVSWSKTRMQNDSQLLTLIGGANPNQQIHNEMAPENITFPHVVFKLELGRKIALTTLGQLLIDVWDYGTDISRREAIAQRLIELFEGEEIPNTSGCRFPDLLANDPIPMPSKKLQRQALRFSFRGVDNAFLSYKLNQQV